VQDFAYDLLVQQLYVVIGFPFSWRDNTLPDTPGLMMKKELFFSFMVLSIFFHSIPTLEHHHD